MSSQLKNESPLCKVSFVTRMSEEKLRLNILELDKPDLTQKTLEDAAAWKETRQSQEISS